MDGKEAAIWECLFLHRQQGLFLSVYVDDINMPGMSHMLDPYRKGLMKHVDLEQPTAFLD